MNTDAMKEMERKPYSSEAMRVRCPHCRKLYLVQFADVKESKPKFECVQCRSRFWLALGDMDLSGEVTGIPVHVKDVPRRDQVAPVTVEAKDPCPKCFKPVAKSAVECDHCGVLIAKARESLNFIENVPRSETLAILWKKVISHYAEPAVHHEFMQACQREGNLVYASSQYGMMLKLMPADELTLKRIEEVKALAGAAYPALAATSATQAKKTLRKFGRLWQVPLLGAAIMILVGMFVPVFRNMIGVGAAFLFLALALQIQFRRRS